MKSILKATESITGKQEASLYVSTIGLEEQQKPIVRPHGLPVYQIFYCTAGSGELVVNEERYCIEAGNGFFLKANEMHSYYKIGSEWRLSYLGFQGTLCEPLLETYGLTKSGAFKVSADQRFMKEFRQLYEYLETFGEQDSAEVSKLCYGCLLEILEDSLNSAMNSIRSSVHDLHDVAVNLEEVEKSLVSEFTFCQADLSYDMSRVVPREVIYCFISITKEALANVIRHSNATKVSVIVREHPALYQLCMRDNGTAEGFGQRQEGIGIANMKERVNALNGTIQITAKNGFRIFITIPKLEGKTEENK